MQEAVACTVTLWHMNVAIKSKAVRSGHLKCLIAGRLAQYVDKTQSRLQ